MDTTWHQTIDCWSANNDRLSQQFGMWMKAFFDSMPSPTLAEIQALNDKKDELVHHTVQAGSKGFVPELSYLNSQNLPLFNFDRHLFEDKTLNSETTNACANIHLYDFHPRDVTTEMRYREYDFQEREEYQKKYSWVQDYGTFLDVVQLFCLQTRLRECDFPRCKELKKRLDEVLPSCEKWERLRDWVLTNAACQLAAAKAGYQWLDDFSAFQWDNLMELKMQSGLTGDPIAVFDICKMTHFWLSQVQIPCRKFDNGFLSFWRNDPATWGWNNGSIPQYVALPAVDRALQKARLLRLCKNRVWNLAYSSERGENDIPALMELAEQTKNSDALAHPEHETCSATQCVFQDENSTLKKQLHKCIEQTCPGKLFPLEELNDAVHLGRSTAWPTASMDSERMSLLPESTQFMAISHVWSDGTGMGVSQAGEVNSCLLLYFKSLAEELECDGIWWDAICIPPERQARRKAISKMHENYLLAKHTVVHDRYLLQCDWANDGSPALALILSPWFTRGWTALELSVTKSIKILFRDLRSPSGYVVKDLDNDILANGNFAKPGHLVASGVISRLRKNEPSITDLLMIMRTRSTTWTRDRIAIASMLARVSNYDYEDSPAAATIKIMQLYMEVPLNFLLHGYETVSTSGGPFSWCPLNLLDGTPATLSNTPSRSALDGNILVDRLGAAIGVWRIRLLKEEEKRTLRPHAMHPSVQYRVAKALEEKWDHCLLLYSDSVGTHQHPALLLSVAGICWPEERYGLVPVTEPYIDGHYIGCVFDSNTPTESYQRLGVRIGCDMNKPTISAKDVVDRAIKRVSKVGLTEDLTKTFREVMEALVGWHLP
ncbi:Ff.00g099890.m01.CDS01 [Fusarium sp. VM40]|nr:Ff.00g099890.m01.CDS01 [Fusarium sp. VM40]